MLPNDVKVFLEEVVSKTKGYDVYLGGYLRDTYYNLSKSGASELTAPMTPKGLDIFFIPKGESYTQLPVLAKMYINYDIMSKDIPNVRENVAQVRGVFMKALSTPDIQFIVYDKHITMQELSEDMDTNINQVMYDVKNESTCMTQDFVEGHANMEIKLIHQFDIERMFSRVRRMSAKFPSYAINFNTWLSREDYEFYERMANAKPKMVRVHAGSFIEDK